jgi:hypothetical protein
MTYTFLVREEHVLPEGQRGSKPARRGAAAMGVLAIVFVAVAAIVTWMGARDDPETLFVLPVPAGDWQLSGGAVTAPVPDADAAGWIVEDGKDTTSTVVTWSPETSRTVSVRSSAPRNLVVDAASGEVGRVSCRTQPRTSSRA